MGKPSLRRESMTPTSGPLRPPRRYELAVFVAALLVASTLLLLLPAGSTAAVSASGAPRTAAPSSAAASAPNLRSNSSGNGTTYWANLTASVGLAPWNRSLAAAAYDPALNATILFGGYNGYGANFPIGDTWMYQGHQWTELLAGGGPTPRWGATMVYDPVDQELVLFGGRNVTAFFNQTWIYNATGWHELNTSTAPSPRYDYGMAYDSALGAIVLYGGAIGNDPAGSFSPFTFYNDTWEYQSGVWTNVTASAGAPPPGRLMRGQMAYDAADGRLVLIGGYEYTLYETGCGIAPFSPAWAETWTFAGTWSQATPGGASPPSGAGAVWYDSETSEVLDYVGMVNGSAGSCMVPTTQVWSYSAGSWSLVTNSISGAPSGRILPVVVDEVGDGQQVMFGGQRVTQLWVGHYLADTWIFDPNGNATQPPAPIPSTRVTVRGTGLPTGIVWGVRFSDVLRNASLLSSGVRAVSLEQPQGVRDFVVTPLMTYGYGIARVTGSRSATYSSVDVRGPTTLVVHFGHFETVTFSETVRGKWTGLPSGQLWSVTLSPKGAGEAPRVYTRSTTGSSLSFVLPAGAVYSVAVNLPSGYRMAPHSSTLTVPDHTLVRSVKIGPSGSGAAVPAALAGPVASSHAVEFAAVPAVVAPYSLMSRSAGPRRFSP